MKRILRVVTLLTLLSSVTVNSQASSAFAVLEAVAVIACNGGNNGSINITPTGGTAPYTYHWSNGATAQNLSGLAAGTYTATITDNTGAIDTISVNITEPAAIVVIKSVTDEHCGGQNVGAVNLNVSGGQGSYSYIWSNGATSQDVSSLTAAVYYVTITDGNGCAVVDSANVTQPPGIGINMAITNVTCSAGMNNGAIAVTVQFGNPAYQYLWNDGTTTQNRSSLGTGNYSLTVTDAIGCTATSVATIAQQPGSMSINPVSLNPTCYNGSNGTINIISVVGSTGPYTFVWNDSVTAQNRTGLSAGTYTVTATSGTSCSASASITLTQPAQINITLHTVPLTCYESNNGAVTSSASSGSSPYSYSWSNGSVTQNIFGLASGSYTLTVTDNKGCTASATAALVSQPLQIIATAKPSPLACTGGPTGSVVTTVSGGTPTYSYWWGSGVVTPDRTNVSAGSYTVTVTDAHGCSVSANAIIAPYTPMTLSSTQTNDICYGYQDGTISINVNNGRAPFTYAWSNADSTASIDSLPIGTYTVTVTDFNSCTITKNTTITSPPFDIVVNSTISDVSCYGQGNGSISLNPLYGAPPYNYKWGNGNTTNSITNLSVGTYVVTITDSSGCKASSNFAVTQPSLITPVAVPSNALCYGGNTGSINLNVTGGYAPFTYAWNDGVDSQARVTLYAGVYTVTMTDNRSCTATANATVSQPSQLLLSTVGINPGCAGGSNGSITLSANGGTPNYVYNWGGGITSQNRNGLPAGTYIVTVTDASGCTSQVSTTLMAPAPVNVTSTATSVACNGGNNGTITLNVNGGTSPFGFDWGGGITTQNRINLTSGSYTVTVTDHAGCTAVNTASVNDITTLSVSSAITNVSCFGMSNGAITASASGGTNPYAFNWTNGSTSTHINSLVAGSYTVTVTDQAGCSTSLSSVISQPALLSVSSSTTPVACFGASTGAVHISVNGGTGAYTYNWGAGIITQNRTNLAAGNYSVTVTDSAGCSVANTSTVGQPTQLTVSSTQTNVVCYGGSNGAIQLSAGGATGPYGFNWGGGITSPNRTGLAAGGYTATINDANGCSTTAVINITQPDVLALHPAVTNVACFGQNTGATALTVSGGTINYSYNWSNGVVNQNLMGVAAGNYSVTVTDANACSASVSVVITQPAQISTSIISVVDASCNGDSNGGVNIRINGGTPAYTYTWSNGSTLQNLSGVASGTYNLSVSDVNGCSTSTSVNITQPNPITLSSSVTNVLCHGNNSGSVLASVSGGNGGFHYNWSNGSTTANISNLMAGNYVLSVQDMMNCSASFALQVTQPAQLALTSSQTNVTCNGGNTGIAGVQATGGSGAYAYQWSNSQTTAQIVQLAQGNYTVTVSDANACSVWAGINITQINPIVVNVSSVNVACFGQSTGSVQAAVSGGAGGYHYAWSNGATTAGITAVASGNYAVTVTDASQCYSSASASISQPAALSAILTATNISCFGGSNGAIIVTVSGGSQPYNYSWSNSSNAGSQQHLSAGAYSVVITDANHCNVSATAGISQPPAIQLSSNIVNTTCFGMNDGSVNVIASGGTPSYIYQWSNGNTSQNLANLSAGTYKLTITDASGCTTSNQNIVVTQPTQLTITSTVSSVGCSGQNDGSVEVTAGGGTPPYLYTWSTSAKTTTIDSLAPGSYSITVNDYNGCLTNKIFDVTSSLPLSIVPTVQNTSCVGVTNGSVSVNVNGGTLPYHYHWSNGQATAVDGDLPAGNYLVTVTDAKGCSIESGGTIAISYELSVHAGTSAVSTNGPPVQLTATASADHGNVYTWTPAGFVTCSTCANTAAMPEQTTLFAVNVTDQNGCKAVDTVTVEVISGTGIFIPNAFTPNDDGVNDQFKIYGDLSNIHYFDILVFDRWGEKVFESNNPNFEWYGAYKGEQAPVGVYIYVATMVFSDGSHKEYKGSLTLLK